MALMITIITSQTSFGRDNTLTKNNPHFNKDLQVVVSDLLAEIRELRQEVEKLNCNDGDGNEIKWKIKKCTDPLIRFLPAGTKCETSNGLE